MLILRAIILSAGTLISGTAFAAEKCYETVSVPEALDCDRSKSKSADFTTGCQVVPATTKKVEIECPGRWVNVKQATAGATSVPPSQAQVCSSVGLSTSKIGGMFCASGERRPMVGGDFALINYKYGKKGDGNGFKGGDKVDKIQRQVDVAPGRDTQYEVRYGHYCYDGGTSEKNNTSEDAVVAYFCE